MNWISVKDKLPEENTDVLCFCENRYLIAHTIDLNAWQRKKSKAKNPILKYPKRLEWRCDYDEDFGYSETPSYRMPLPKLPKDNLKRVSFDLGNLSLDNFDQQDGDSDVIIGKNDLALLFSLCTQYKKSSHLYKNKMFEYYGILKRIAAKQEKPNE